ncbi:hypothetical protein [Scatolibacter rhodanostii]|uniref:hypothetical protein n=1 Tax=Scatolibacter rhodanostii TaxID=2014781 RepID=UPI00117C1A49|nr:hypothetical protein [Scatolibacter rhodanostii]
MMTSAETSSANTSYIESNDTNTQQSQEIRAVVTKQTNILPSVLAFLLLAIIPVLYVLFVWKKRKTDPNYFRSNAQRYSPKQEITFSNNTFDSEYNRSRM